MSKRRVTQIVMTVGALLTWLAAASQAEAQTETFYKGRTLTVIVGYSSGGGYDQYTRVMARHLGRNIPGQPQVIVQNMPGAGTLTAVRYLDSAGPRDGTVMTNFDPGLIMSSLSEPERVPVKLSDYWWVGAMMRDQRVCFASIKSGLKTWDDLLSAKEFVMGSTARGSGNHASGAILRSLFGAPVRFVFGYPGSNEQRLALERGELDGGCGSWSAVREDWYRHGGVSVLVRFGQEPPPGMPASARALPELATTAEQRALLALFNAASELARPFIMSTQVPRDRALAMRQAFDVTMADPALHAEMKQQSMELNPVSGAEAAGIVERIYQAPPELAVKMKRVLE